MAGPPRRQAGAADPEGWSFVNCRLQVSGRGRGLGVGHRLPLSTNAGRKRAVASPARSERLEHLPLGLRAAWDNPPRLVTGGGQAGDIFSFWPFPGPGSPTGIEGIRKTQSKKTIPTSRRPVLSAKPPNGRLSASGRSLCTSFFLQHSPSQSAGRSPQPQVKAKTPSSHLTPRSPGQGHTSISTSVSLPLLALGRMWAPHEFLSPPSGMTRMGWLRTAQIPYLLLLDARRLR